MNLVPLSAFFAQDLLSKKATLSLFIDKVAQTVGMITFCSHCG